MMPSEAEILLCIGLFRPFASPFCIFDQMRKRYGIVMGPGSRPTEPAARVRCQTQHAAAISRKLFAQPTRMAACRDPCQLVSLGCGEYGTALAGAREIPRHWRT